MKVDFNSLRLNAIREYNNFTRFVRDNIDPSEHEILHEAILDLGNSLVAIACTYEDGDKDFRDLTDYIEIEGICETAQLSRADSAHFNHYHRHMKKK